MVISSFQTPLHSSPVRHPLPSGSILPSLGGHFTYRIVGPCCRLFDREQLPWPCCRLQWRGKEPSWRRIGRRFTADLAAQRSPSYVVEILEPGHAGELIVLTIYCDRLTPEQQSWWYSQRKTAARLAAKMPSSTASPSTGHPESDRQEPASEVIQHSLSLESERRHCGTIE